uniref:Putative transposase n=1 Tax=Ixodes ricinus TaxID=34613 RepID=A0A6B0V4B5_IXORI
MFVRIRQKQGRNTNPNVSQVTSGLKHIGIQKLSKLSEKGNVEDDGSGLLQELSPFSLQSESLADIVECVPPDNFPPLDNIAELAAHDDSHIIEESATYYVAEFLTKLFAEKTAPGFSCSELLKNEHDTLYRPHQYFTMLKAYHIPGKLFGNLTVPSEAAFRYIQQLELHFLSVIERVSHLRNVCGVLYAKLVDVGSFMFCTKECHTKFLKMFCRVRLCWHIRFINRNLDRVRLQTCVSGAQLVKFKG